MAEANLEELFINASESDSQSLITELSEKLNTAEGLSEDNISGSIELLLESWENSISDSEAKAAFIIKLAGLRIKDSAQIRNALTKAVKKLLPPYLRRSGFLRGLGIRNSETPLKEIHDRYSNLLNLKNNVFVYLPDSKTWGKIIKIDEFTSSIGLSNIKGTNSFAVPLEKALSGLKFFNAGTETHKLALPGKKDRITSSKYRKLLQKSCFTPLSDDEMKEIAFASTVPGVVDQNEFEAWWEKNDSPATEPASSGGKRKPSQARSIHEMHVLLKEAEEENAITFGDEDISGYTQFFSRLKKDIPEKNLAMLMECIAILTAAGAESAIFDPLKDKCAFWPESFEKIELEKIQCWSKIPAKYLEGFAQTTKKLFSEEYLAEAAVHVPLKCLNTICLQISDHIISETASNFNAGSDILVWIWRNRKKHTQELTKTLNMDNVIFALSQVNLPKAWGNAQRELKKLLLDKPDFQKFLIKNAEDNYSSIITAMRKSKSFSRGEQQSLLVKLSRYSPGLRDIIEKGEGKKFGRQDEAQNNLPGRPPITSMKSHRLRLKELNDIINVQIPENREALKTARAHGDFRENAEYDAAKERRDFLANRRAELESAVNSVIQTDFRNVELKGTVLPGTTVNIVYDSGKTEKFYIVGIWDGNPEKHRVSYKTRLGECLIDSKAGDKIKLPDGKTCTITEINVLPESLRAELADEI